MSLNAEEIFRAEGNTQAKKKLKNYALNVFRSESFQNTIVKLRKKYSIPENGYKEDEGGIVPPPQLLGSHDAAMKISDEVEKICRKFKLHFIAWTDEILYYLCYNQLLGFGAFEQNLIMLADLANEKNEPFSESIQKEDVKHFPIALRLSPYASERDIIDFVKKTYKPLIFPFLKQYQDKKNKIGKLKTRNQAVQKRNDFIYQNRNKPIKEIRQLLAEKGIFLDDGHISKIISVEKQRRKEV